MRARFEGLTYERVVLEPALLPVRLESLDHLCSLRGESAGGGERGGHRRKVFE